MKKRMSCLLMMVCMMLSLVACGKDKDAVEKMTHSASYSMETESDGLMITDTVKLNANGDNIHEIIKTVNIDMTSCEENIQTLMTAVYNDLVIVFEQTEGVSCTGSVKDGTYDMELVIDANSDALESLAMQGLVLTDAENLSEEIGYLGGSGELVVKGVLGKCSFKDTCEQLLANGYTEVIEVVTEDVQEAE